MKKLTALVLSLLMLLTAASALAEYPIVQEPITLRVFQYALENQRSFLRGSKELEETTSVVEVVKTRWNRPRRLADLSSAGDEQGHDRGYGPNQGILIPLDDYLAEYAQLLQPPGHEQANAAIRPRTAKHWIGALTAQRINHDGTFFINRCGWRSWDCRSPDGR